MLGRLIITRTEHDRVVAERDGLSLKNQMLRDDYAKLRASHSLLKAALDAKNRMLAKVHTTRGPGGRFVKREERQS